MTSRRAFLGAAASPLLSLSADGAGVRISHAQPCMGTLFRVLAWTSDEDAGYRAIRHAFIRANELDATFSDYKQDSELSRLMREGFGKPFAASGDLFRVVLEAQQVAERTQGLFDITVGPLSQLWRRSRQAKRLPEEAVLREAQARVGYRHIHLEPGVRSIELKIPGMRLDLGGIAKGFAADAMLSVLAEGGVVSAMVAAGGDVAAADPPPGAKGWTVMLNPGQSSGQRKESITIRQQAVSTSGAQSQNVVIDGRTYSHIVDPRTGLGLTKPTAVSVVAPTATMSDALATAASVMDAPEALAFLGSQPGVFGRVFRPPEREGSEPDTVSTPGFQALIRQGY
ncbi:MAG: FAD:protein FMN transferase [Bryobacterales bacterium]|nr:FAD:protein FMN transferase [Bryobacterales bacterium]